MIPYPLPCPPPPTTPYTPTPYSIRYPYYEVHVPHGGGARGRGGGTRGWYRGWGIWTRNLDPLYPYTLLWPHIPPPHPHLSPMDYSPLEYFHTKRASRVGEWGGSTGTGRGMGYLAVCPKHYPLTPYPGTVPHTPDPHHHPPPCPLTKHHSPVPIGVIHRVCWRGGRGKGFSRGAHRGYQGGEPGEPWTIRDRGTDAGHHPPGSLTPLCPAPPPPRP
jgi:hypothetical protein